MQAFRSLFDRICIALNSYKYYTQSSDRKETIMAKNPIVTITMKDGGVIKCELYPEVAPESVNNFISLINKHFYDGLIFHRVIRGFMIQGGWHRHGRPRLQHQG